jgi:biotin carboxylase
MAPPDPVDGRVLLLMSPATYRAEAFTEAARRLGLPVVTGIDMDPDLTATWRVPLGLDFRDPEGAVRAIVAYAERNPLRAVLAVDDSGTVLAARASEALGLPHNPVEAAIAARDKHRMRQLLAAAGVPSPEFRLFDAEEEPARIAAGVDYPCVLKPILLSGSRGVIRADDPSSFVAAWDRLRRILRTAERERRGGTTAGGAGGGAGPGARSILVEGFIPGREVALEGILAGGELAVLALFDKPDPLDGPYFEETIYVTPSRLTSGVQETIATCAARAAAALGLREGPVHAELRVNEAGPWIVEVAGRSIGGLCSRILRFGTGMSLEELILRHAAGLEIPTLRRAEEQAGPVPAVGVMMIPIPAAGVLRAVTGVAEAEATAGIDEVRITARPGHVLVPLPEGASYLGFIFARGASPHAVEASLRTAHRALHFDVTPELPMLDGD